MEAAQQVVMAVKDNIEIQLIADVNERMALGQKDPMVQMHELEMEVKERIEAAKLQLQRESERLDVQKAVMSEETKRLGIDAKQQSDNEKIAQQREAEYIKAGVENVKTFAGMVKESESNDVRM